MLSEDGILTYIPNFMSDEHLLPKLLKEIDWQQNQIRIFGKSHPEPRLTAWFGPPYTYSSISWPPKEMPGFLAEIIAKINDIKPFEYNAVLLNQYRNGNDSMGWHRDNEKEIDSKLIASLSLGASRKFKLRHRHKALQHELMLHHGDLLLMENMQEHWEHSIPKSSIIHQTRINLTFRHIIS